MVFTAIITASLSFAGYGWRMVDAANKMSEVPAQVETLNGWMRGRIIADSLLIISIREEIERGRKRDEQIFALYKYLKIWTPEMSKITTPEKIK